MYTIEFTTLKQSLDSVIIFAAYNNTSEQQYNSCLMSTLERFYDSEKVEPADIDKSKVLVNNIGHSVEHTSAVIKWCNPAIT